MTTHQTISANLQFLRKSHNMTRRQIAAILSVGERAFDSYVEGRAIPRLDTLIAICDHFRLSLDELVRVDLIKCYMVREERYLVKINEAKLFIHK